MSSLTPADLLTIDVDAEIRKLGTRWVAGEPERAVELARLLVSLGAAELSIIVGRRRLELRAPGAGLPGDTLAALELLGNARAAAATRHEALTSLEATSGLALIGLAAADSAELFAAAPEGSMLWRRHAGREAVSERGPGGAARLELRLWQPERGVEAALRRACAHARLPVRVNGEVVNVGRSLPDCLLVREIAGRGFGALVGLPRGGQLSRVTVLVHEVVEREVYRVSRHGFVNTALVWLENGAALGAPLLADLEAALAAARSPLLVELAASYEALPPVDRAPARELLVRRALAAGDARVLGCARLFARAAGAPLDVEGVRALAESGGLWATAASESGSTWSVDPGRVLRLDRRELELLRALADLALHAPPRVRPPSLGERLWRHLRRLLGTVAAPGREVPERASAPSDDRVERLRATVERELRSGRFELPAVPVERSQHARVVAAERGRLPLRPRTGANGVVVRLPRHHPAVLRLAELLAQDGASLRPVMAALFGGHDGWARADL